MISPASLVAAMRVRHIWISLVWLMMAISLIVRMLAFNQSLVKTPKFWKFLPVNIFVCSEYIHSQRFIARVLCLFNFLTGNYFSSVSGIQRTLVWQNCSGVCGF